MDIYAQYKLPAPPPPTVFSRDHGPNRARMPNFTSVEEVSAFIAKSIVWEHSKAADVFLIFCIVFTTTIVVVLSAFSLHKIYKRAWWLFRISPRGHRLYIVPNVHTSWALFIGFYGMTLISSFILNHIGDARHEPIIHNGLWITLIWTPIPFAAWYQTYGIVAARVEQTYASHKDALSPIPAWAINTVAVGLPGVPALIAIIPGILADLHLEGARHAWYDWHTEYDGVTELNRELILDAQNIFHESIRGCYYLSAMMLVWAVTVMFFGGSYAYSAFQLVRHLRRNLNGHSAPVTHRSHSSPMSPVHPKMQADMGIESASLGAVYDGPSDMAIKWAMPSVTTGTPMRKQTIREAIDEQIHSQLFSRSEVQHDRAMSYFPPVKPSRTIHSVKSSTAKRVLLYFEIQAACVVMGGLGFLITIFYMVIGCAPAAERNEAEKVEITCYIMVSALSVIFGMGSSISMTHASFEASFSSLLSSYRVERKVTSSGWTENAT
ncbi:hypothetical protein OC834_005294 [Tilletia horrida]|nr:hypothetical protein OC834_005294 [Tilletia horrida]